MNPVINIVLITSGIIAMAFPPVGMIILTIAFFSIRARKSRNTTARSAAQARAIEKDRRIRILAFKSLP